MITIIQEKLTEIEKEYGIFILFACESGSRGWGFPSPDSDYDVRFIYTHPANHYLTVQKKTDQFTFPITDELDINGWDVSKTIQLITRSNVTPSEWLQSPVIYREDNYFKTQLWGLCQSYFCARSSAHHYLGVARQPLESLTESEIKIKKLFYLLRSLLSAYWCIEKQEIAPMNIFPLLEIVPEEIKTEIQNLVTLKADKKEGYTVKVSSLLQEWIENRFEYCSLKSGELEKCSHNPEPADEIFRKIIRKYDHTGH